MSSFSQIIGHERQKHLLRQAWQHQRLAHAYLFSGPAGIGKRLIALALARLLFCPSGTGCGQCPVCRRIDHNNHPDLHLVEPVDGQILIEAIRTLQQQLALRPYEADRHIVLIDDAHLLNSSAANALLKTLEEPPGSCLLLLISSQPQQLLDTIRSRCQTLPFNRLGTGQISQILQQQIADPEQRELLIRLTEGSLTRALGSDHELYLQRRRSLFAQLSRLSPQTIVPLLELAEELAGDKEQLPELLGLLLSCYRDVFILAHQGAAALVINRDLLDPLTRLAHQCGPQRAGHRLAALLQAHSQLLTTANRQLIMENLLIRLVS